MLKAPGETRRTMHTALPAVVDSTISLTAGNAA